MDEKKDTFLKAMKEERFGKFFIGRNLIEFEPDQVMRLMRNFLIVRAEMHLASMNVEYEAYSPLFDQVPIGEKRPTYIIEKILGDNEKLIDLKITKRT